MKLHFDPNQEFQTDAIKSIVDLFEGQPLKAGEFEFSIESVGLLTPDGGIGNQLKLGENQILQNLQSIQKFNEIPESDKLDGMRFGILQKNKIKPRSKFRVSAK